MGLLAGGSRSGDQETAAKKTDRKTHKTKENIAKASTRKQTYLKPQGKLVRMRGPKHIRKASKESKASKVSKARKISTAVTADE